MACFHIEQVKSEINDILSKLGNYDSSIYKQLGPITKTSEVRAKMESTGGIFFSDYKATPYYTSFIFNYISPN